jgi:hypothetical protein
VGADLSRAVWHKSAFSNGSDGDRVEVARNAFIAGAKAGEFGYTLQVISYCPHSRRVAGISSDTMWAWR